ncbi:putative hydrolase [Martiniozyma asiatica (nom. inval.)]|nr:putative hydrolase [Martiniozyma asiatica]
MSSIAAAAAAAAAAPLSLAKAIQVALLQFHAGSDKAKNFEKVSQIAKIALEHEPRPELLVLPECFQSPYAVDQFKHYAEPIPNGPTTEFLSKLAKDNNVCIVGGSFPESEGDKIYNTSLTFNNKGEIVGKHRKVHLFDIDIPNGIKFQESISLSAGNKATVFDLPLGRFGVGICYDVRFPELAMTAARKGAGVMVYPGAFNTVTGPKFWTKFAVARAIDNQMWVIMCSPARQTDGGYMAYGHSLIVDPNGNVVVEIGEGEGVAYAEIGVEKIKEARESIPITVQRRFDVYDDVAESCKCSAV